jgi:hypothetical protein
MPATAPRIKMPAGNRLSTTSAFSLPSFVRAIAFVFFTFPLLRGVWCGLTLGFSFFVFCGFSLPSPKRHLSTRTLCFRTRTHTRIPAGHEP